MAQQAKSLVIAKGTTEIAVLSTMANRHGLIAGATGTGKTVTLRVLAEQFSRIGVPVFMADVKGDLSGIAMAGGDRPEFSDRAKKLGISDYAFDACPIVFWATPSGRRSPRWGPCSSPASWT
jgi:DNA helicase HerA-like ATPase